ncbi:hypothetical protein REPUB_Repub07fG0179300 [Reevesia pubescens]
MNQMRNRRELTPAQRIAKIDRDRRRRREHKEEFKGLQQENAELQALSVTQRNENRRLTEEKERLNDMMSNLKETVNQLHEQIRELKKQNLGLQETMKLADSFFEYASPNEEVANNEPITQGPGSSQSGILNVDELVVEDFVGEILK